MINRILKFIRQQDSQILFLQLYEIKRMLYYKFASKIDKIEIKSYYKTKEIKKKTTTN